MRLGGFFIPREIVLEWSLRLGGSNERIIHMKDNLQLLTRPLKTRDIHEAFDYFASYAKDHHKAFAHMAYYPVWDVEENCGMIIVRHKAPYSHEAAEKVGLDSRRLPQFKKTESDDVVGKLIEELFGAHVLFSYT